MIKYVLLLIFPILFCSQTACRKQPLNADYLIIGAYASECGGNCANFFMLRKDKVYADRMEYYNRADEKLRFKTTSLPIEKSKVAQTLNSDLQEFFKNNESQAFGCPDCADGGAMYLEMRVNGTTKKYLIDNGQVLLNNSNAIIFQKIGTTLSELSE